MNRSCWSNLIANVEFFSDYYAGTMKVAKVTHHQPCLCAQPLWVHGSIGNAVHRLNLSYTKHQIFWECNTFNKYEMIDVNI